MNEFKKRVQKLESVIKVQKADWKYYLENPNELTAKQAEFFRKEKTELYNEMTNRIIKEMELRL